MQDKFPPGSFSREDERPDSEFYAEPRLVQHIDDYAIRAVGEAYRQFLPPDGEYLDLMSSWVSHFPEDMPVRRLVGLGMNEVELARNPRLAEYVVHDLNADPKLPFADARFDGVVIAVSVQYLTRPIEVFAEIGRVLKPGAPLVVCYSNRCFPTKAVRIWNALEDREKADLIAMYILGAGMFEPPEYHDFSPARTLIGVPMQDWQRVRSGQLYTDPLYVVVARRRQDA
ncbi:MAG TPA: methyltransferase domain-containing protein [Dehalococcoidia bacterium]|nr:methyltransferase domain-containing protein [Dehalococcoidia bacterium]